MKRINIEIAVGLFMVVGFVCFAWMSVRLGDVGLFNPPTYSVTARFGSVSGLKVGAKIEIAGVNIGKVHSIALDPETYEAVVELQIKNEVVLQEDVIASIRTAGIIGDRYVNITPGGLEETLADGDMIEETESAINLEELISKYIFQK